MARKDISNGQSYNQGFYNTNDNFIELYNIFESGFKYRGNLTSLYPEGKSLNALLPGIYNVNSWSNITDYPPDAYPYGLLVVFTPSIATFAKAQMYFPDNRDFYYYRNGYGASYNAWREVHSIETGIWTPAIMSTTTAATINYTTQEGYFVKVGKIVHISFFIRCTLTGGSGAIRLTGVPVAPQNYRESGIGYCSQIGSIRYANSSALNQFNLYKVANNALLETTEVNNGSTVDFVGSITYRVD